jgi:multidrug efflux pump subunit AcrB
MLWARHSGGRLFAVGSAAVLFGLAFVLAGGFLFQKVTFNIFPPSKDTNGLTVQLQFAPGTTIEQAQAVADRANRLVADQLGENFETASYYANATDRSARLVANIIPYEERDVRSPELRTQLQEAFEGFQGAQVEVGQLDVGPPASAFSVRIMSEDRDKAFKLAQDLRDFLANKTLIRTSGETARMTEVTVADPGTYSRAEGESYIAVTAGFDADDTSALVTLAQGAVRDEFNEERLRSYGLPADAINYDLGQEQENQDSFKALALAFPLLLLAIYILLAVQFRSFLQPLLIFMAIPFSLFGITLGLYLTDNAFSFFAMLGFFALVGLSLKNTILLTDYANQLRRTGASAVDAAVGALHERFRPLIATSLTAVVSLVPLALTSPFWEGLAIVLIGGLLSSTFLVITVFPYYYLGAEFLRVKTRRKSRR